MMIVTTTYLSMFEIIPMAFGRRSSLVYYNYGITLYLLLNVLGNFVNAYFADNNLKSVPAKKLKEYDSEMDVMCKRCKEKVPPRVHHCVLCDMCIMKRDHHCFFLCGCIGYHNHKYFILFCFYMVFGGIYSGILTLIHLNLMYSVKFKTIFNLFTLLPTTIQSWYFDGNVTSHHMFLVGVFYGCMIACLAAAGFFYWQIAIITSGQTTYEARCGITTFKKSWKKNFKDVFGPYWYLSFIIPIRIPQQGYGLYRGFSRKIRGNHTR